MGKSDKKSDNLFSGEGFSSPFWKYNNMDGSMKKDTRKLWKGVLS